MTDNQKRQASYRQFKGELKKEDKNSSSQLKKKFLESVKEETPHSTRKTETTSPIIKKAIFPSLQESYSNEKLRKQQAAKYNLVDKEKSIPPLDMPIEHNLVCDNKAVNLRVVPPSSTMQEELANQGLLKSQKNGNGYRKVAKLLILLGKENAASILKHLSQDEITKITAEIATIHSISQEEATQIMRDYNNTKEAEKIPKGGADVAKEFLIKTYGEKEGIQKFNQQISSVPSKQPFDFLDDIEAYQLYQLLKDESALVLATIITFLKKEQASWLLRELPPALKVEVTKRIAKMERLDQEAILNLELALKEKIRKEGKQKTTQQDGSSTLANILKYMDINSEQEILKDIHQHSAQLSKQVKEKIFSIDMLLQVFDKDLQKVLSEYDNNSLAIILKGKSQEIQEKILSNVSANRAQILMQEKELLGAMKKSEVDEETKKLLVQLRRMHLFGEIQLKLPGEEWL